LPELSPLHRIDRDTAGLGAFFRCNGPRGGLYQGLFRDRAITKHYEAGGALA
jgi:tRNA pseudouridine32 synthase/23S rRNA pseudouridine746 synthase